MSGTLPLTRGTYRNAALLGGARDDQMCVDLGLAAGRDQIRVCRSSADDLDRAVTTDHSNARRLHRLAQRVGQDESAPFQRLSTRADTSDVGKLGNGWSLKAPAASTSSVASTFAAFSPRAEFHLRADDMVGLWLREGLNLGLGLQKFGLWRPTHLKLTVTVWPT